MSVGLWGSMQTHGSKPLPGVFLCSHEVPSQCPSVTLLTRPSEARVNQSSHYIVYPVTGLSHATIPLFSLNQCLSSLGLLGPILASTCCSTRYTTQIKSPPDKMIPHTRTILTPAAPYEHHAVLLHIMSLTRNVRGDDFAVGQADFGGLALARVGLFRLCHAHFQTDTFHFGPFLRGKRRGHGVPGFLGVSTLRADLVQCHAAARCRGEGA